MSIYTLADDEIVIIQEPKVREENSGTITLILTNQNLIQVKQNIFGNDKDYEKYSLLDLRASDGNPNVLVGKSKSGSRRLELYFSSFVKFYSFESMFGERKWAAAIIRAYKTCAAEYKKNHRETQTGSLFSPIANVVDAAKKQISMSQKPSKTSTCKCPKCGAEVLGKKGDEIICSYCGAVIHI